MQFMLATVASLALAMGGYFVAAQGNPGAETAPTLEHLRTHSLYIPFVDDELRIRYWDYGGHTILNTNKHVRLTADTTSRQGYIWSKLPLPETAWQVEFEFNVNGYSSHIYGDGFAFWATTGRANQGGVFGSQDFFNGVGIFFDSYANGRTDVTFPYVSVMLGDGRKSYDHTNDGKSSESGGCSYDFRGADKIMRAKVTYYKGAQLKLELQEQNEAWTECVNLAGVTLPEKVYLGFSAMTGEVSDNHDINYVSTSEITSTPPTLVGGQSVGGGGSFGHSATASSGSGAFGFILKLLLFSGICGAAFVGYQMWQQQNNKRF